MRTKTIAIALGLLAAGCGEQQDVAALPGDDVVLAEVEGTTITRYDLDRAILTTLGPLAGSLDDEGRHDVLESLVTSRAIAMARERELDADRRAALEREVEAHREQLLVRQYLAEHAPNDGPDEAEIRAYYDAHPDRFGAHAVRAVEMLVTTRDPSDEERTQLLELLRDAGARRDWAALAAELASRGLPVARQESDSENAMLHARLRQAIRSLDAGQASGVLFVEGRAFVVRVTAETQSPPRPFAEVHDEIRTTLAPRSTRDAIRSVRDEVLRDVHVVYRDTDHRD